jgi:hypothetical protein
MGFAHHEVGFQVAETGTLVDNFRTLFDTHAIDENPSGVVIIAPFTPSPAMFEVFVQIRDVWVLWL